MPSRGLLQDWKGTLLPATFFSRRGKAWTRRRLPVGVQGVRGMGLDMFFYYCFGMDRRPWSAEQDQILKDLFQKVKLNKWSLIARRMEEEYNLGGRSGKQCRERYNNHLNPLTVRDSWGDHEERLLFRLHDELGNKWAVIAGRLGGRTDNSVKNHFFAKLRKAMRRVNKLITEARSKELKEVKLNLLYKIIEAHEERFKKNPLCTLATSTYACTLKNKILLFAYDAPDAKEPDRQSFEQLIRQIHDFGKNYKRKPKQLRRIASEGIEIPEDLISYPAHDHLSQSQDSEDEIVHQPPQPVLWKTFQPAPVEPVADKMNLRSQGRAEEKPVTKVQQMLLHQGLLEQDDDDLPPIPGMIRKHTSSEFLMEGQQREVFFLDESEGDAHLPTPLHFNHAFKKESQSEEQLFS